MAPTFCINFPMTAYKIRERGGGFCQRLHELKSSAYPILVFERLFEDC